MTNNKTNPTHILKIITIESPMKILNPQDFKEIHIDLAPATIPTNSEDLQLMLQKADKECQKITKVKPMLMRPRPTDMTHKFYKDMTAGELLKALGMDAGKWLNAFCDIVPEAKKIDRETLRTWVANMIMAGYDHAKGVPIHVEDDRFGPSIVEQAAYNHKSAIVYDEGEWQDIETAPLKGLIDLWADNKRYIDCYRDDINQNEWRCLCIGTNAKTGSAANFIHIVKNPTHWRPIKPPITEALTEKGERNGL